MIDKDLTNLLNVTQLVDPAVVTADVDSASVDMQGYNSCMFVVNVGESGDTLSGSVYLELEVEESTDDSTFTDAADADVRGYVAGNNDGCFGVIDAAAEDDAVFTCQYTGNARYARVVLNVTGTHTNGIPVSVTAIQAGDQILP